MPAWQNRVTRGDDYRRTVRSGRRVAGAYSIVHAVFRSPEAPGRFGFIVSKAVGNAVTRNLVRRRLKTIADRSLQSGFAGYDIVIRALPLSATASYAELEIETQRSIARSIQLREARRAKSAESGALQ